MSHELKRGHNSEFGLSEKQLELLLNHCTSYTTKHIIVQARLGRTVKELSSELGISRVAVWRRVKKALAKAVEEGVLSLDLEKLPFPTSLKYISPGYEEIKCPHCRRTFSLGGEKE